MERSIDREKVIKGLEHCSSGDGCKGCPYSQSENGHVCSFNCIREAIVLLKEQEAEWIYGEDETGADGWHCSECNFFEPWFYDFDDDIDFIKRYEHCPKCGRRMILYTGKHESR